MLAHDDQVVELFGEPSYGFDDEGPYYSVRHAGTWGHTTYVDPAPCYPHDVALVQRQFNRMRELAPLPIPMKVAILSREPLERTNGWYNDEHGYDENDKGSPVGVIYLAGKRIPPHPAMTRYLVSHEYGHAVAYHLARFRGETMDQFKTMYLDYRSNATRDYGCGHWHSNVGELIANDFRILVAGVEAEFWPHAGFARPEDLPALGQFWLEALAILRGKPRTEQAHG